MSFLHSLLMKPYFCPQKADVSQNVLKQNIDFLWETCVMGHKSFLNCQIFCYFFALFFDLKAKGDTFIDEGPQILWLGYKNI